MVRQKILGPSKNCSPKIILVLKDIPKQSLGPKNIFGSENSFGPNKIFGPKKNFCPKIDRLTILLGIINFCLKKIVGKKNFQLKKKFWSKYQPSGAGGTRSPPATPPRPLYPKWPMGSGNRSNLRLLDPPINFR